MNAASTFPLFRPSDAPFVIIKDARLEFDSLCLPMVSQDQVSNIRALAHKSQYVEFKDSSRFSVVIRDYMFRHYFHFIETFLTLYATQKELLPHAKLERIYLGDFEWSNPLQNNVQKNILSLLYPDAEIVTDEQPESTWIETLLYIDRSLSVNSVNKMIEPALLLIIKHGRALRNDIYEKLAIKKLETAANGRPLKLLYVPRHPPRSLSKELETELLGLLSEVGHVDVIDFANLTWQDQVRAAASHDIMVGVHGNGLTNLLWLPCHGMAMEIFPEFAHQYDYQMLAEVMGLEYFGFEGGRVFRPFVRHGWPYLGGPNPINKLMMEQIKSALSIFTLQRMTA
jgi:Glycosyltransferase 61